MARWRIQNAPELKLARSLRKLRCARESATMRPWGKMCAALRERQRRRRGAKRGTARNRGKTRGDNEKAKGRGKLLDRGSQREKGQRAEGPRWPRRLAKRGAKSPRTADARANEQMGKRAELKRLTKMGWVRRDDLATEMLKVAGWQKSRWVVLYRCYQM